MNQRADPIRDAGIVIHSSIIGPPVRAGGRMEFTKTALRTGEELCSLGDWYGTGHSNSRNDVSTLIKRDKWVIEKFWTAHGKSGAHVHYKLLREGPIKATQRALFA